MTGPVAAWGAIAFGAKLQAELHAGVEKGGQGVEGMCSGAGNFLKVRVTSK
jgi:hypothetical protein